MDKQNVVYQYNAVLFGNIMELSTYTHYNMNKPKNVNAKWKKSGTKGQRPQIKIPFIRNTQNR